MAEGTGTGLAIRNLDVVLPGYIEIHAPTRAYRLRDDIGTLLGLLGYRVQALMAELPSDEEARALPIAQIVARHAAYDEELLAACAAFFRHTYPDITEDEVAEALPSEGSRMALLAAFFTSRSAPSGAQPSVSSASFPAETATQTESGLANEPQPSAKRAAASPSSPAATSKSKRSSRTS